ncbi:uncharacterized protein BO96DRAFT_351496 [Aspergillus niger CBS 101883]|uniref:Contig An16c0300, genomic contig n=2 Tax=Aspergillus niger TaxID=5061 RepID=A2R927_ASPNC|nr:uncharacterized protein BO96DRAFT_351496 [Aspergillus niger CBS 101883]XP_059604945.1 uncharacterized protein An16g09220 [Aspergillus niger]PYH50873.1 hypothetical protein BO96DRAFT_351496 [Aspergillus niger CBS 101883]CAK47118.1 unnamed protein product [Aspergillus niger]
MALSNTAALRNPVSVRNLMCPGQITPAKVLHSFIRSLCHSSYMGTGYGGLDSAHEGVDRVLPNCMAQSVVRRTIFKAKKIKIILNPDFNLGSSFPWRG